MKSPFTFHYKTIMLAKGANMKRWILALAVPLTLSGCVSMSDPMSLGNDVYTLHATGGAYTTQAYLRSDLWEEATELCAKEGKVPVLLNQDGVSGHASFGAPPVNTGGGFAGGFAAGFGSVRSFSYPESSIVFRCVKPTTPQDIGANNDSAWVNTSLDPSKIIAIDVANIKRQGDIGKATNCSAFIFEGRRAIFVSDLEYDCKNWRYRGEHRIFLINGTSTNPSDSPVEKWNYPTSSSPLDRQLTLVCKGVPSEALRDAVRENDPVRYANYALDRIQK